ncbi:MAG: TonB-dependent receptor [Sphingomonadaceae bacterium]|uniref:TonB-dependent receptor n=1 Tax=Thermaurantiacus sp. TaxID=2820283 RepID=UPI00298ED177|nr:TonB-dependent receptor [Thermaurantiacus sp.]MCS6987405.1 TonB-dependent receptor [Sphingomonadaceae bacterium]MDW8415325.1 TonB-dependent receptor [Thermaurantiacus sp.]
MTGPMAFARGALRAAVSLVALVAGPALAQTAETGGTFEDIIVTAQRQAQSLQDVPIAISAFSTEALERQQINNVSDLQLNLPNVSFTKGNFAGGANFTIRGVGDAAVATSGDTSLGLHVNEIPQAGNLFEADYFDLERIEVLRGPQGTLFGRNATSGVLNFVTARPVLGDFQARAFVEYGNYDSLRTEGMLNIPLGERFGLRIAGTTLNRDGFTKNLYTGNRIDGRDQWAVRGTLRWEPSDRTLIDIIGYVYREDSNRSRIQKQLCNRDPTGVLGCLPDRLAFQTLNGNGTLGGTITSREFFGAISGGALAPFGIGSVYGRDAYAGAVNPPDVRVVNIDYEPTYKSRQSFIHFKGQQEIGDDFTFNLSGGWSKGLHESRTDYNLSAADPFNFAPGGGIFALRNFPLFAQGAQRLFRGNTMCVSQVSRRYVGFINNEIDRCAAIDVNYDLSTNYGEAWTVEGILKSNWEGRFNFLLGAIYLRGKASSDYFVASSSLDYGAIVLGAAQGGPNAASGSPFFNSETDLYRLKSYGIFGEVYFDLTPNLRFTGGVRYSNDDKFVRDRQFLYNFPIPYGTTDLTQTPQFAQLYDADPSRPGRQPFREASAKFDAVTGRAVLDWRPDLSFTDDTLVYFSYARGYKSGGINPPFDPTLFTAPVTFQPEFINAFEVGLKNTFRGGQLQANLTGFYYDYKGLQLSRILNRTSFNDNTDASIHGIEGEFVIAPSRRWLFNITASYLDTKVKKLSLVDVRDPSGGTSDTVIIKDLAGGANCVFQVKGNPALANGFVAAFNAALGLRPPTPIPATTTTGAFSLCNALRDAAVANRIPVTLDTSGILPAGIEFDLKGNELPNSPNFKVAVGGQYTLPLPGDFNLVVRVDYSFTDDFYSRTFNRPIDRVPSYEIVNAQAQVNSPDGRWFVRAFVQNAFDSDAITGQYITDPSSGLFTNIFTLEPRRYGIAVGASF